MVRNRLAVFGLGAAAMYFYDPLQGRRRRHQLRDRFRHVWHVERNLARKASRDLSNRVRGVIATRGGIHETRPANPPPELRDRWRPAGQLGATVAGGALALWGVRSRSLVGTLAAVAGGALLLRATMNEPWRRILGIGDDGDAVFVQKTIHVDAPLAEVFALWSRFEDFPRFMQHVQRVDVDRTGERERSHWVVDGPAGVPVSWDAETVRVVPDRLIEWRTRADQAIEHSGRVGFEAANGGTRVQVEMHFSPPAGAIGNTIAALFGWDPKARMDDDMVRMKALLEQGRTRAHGSSVTLEQLEARQRT